MTGLKGVRVIVIDDDEKDAVPILKAFSKKGISAAFFDGNPGGLPLKKDRLSGVRLAILDMDLVGGGVSNKDKASTLVTCLKKILSSNNGPYVALAWTKHPELLEFFEQYIFLTPDIPTPICSLMIAKTECKKNNGDFDLTILSAKLNEKLKQFSPLIFLQSWEEKCFMASSDVTNTLSDLTSNAAAKLEEYRNHWKSQLLEIMHTVSKEAIGKHLNEDTVLSGFYNSLNPLHADKLDNYTSELSKTLSSISTEIISSDDNCGIKQKARINTMLHLSFDNLYGASAGYIYKLPAGRKPAWGPEKEELLEDFVTGKDKMKDENKKAVSPLSIPVLIEMNANCDHAQKNIRIARFLAGLLIPEKMHKKLKKTDFIWKFGPVFLNQANIKTDQYFFYLSARHLVTCDMKQAAKLKVFGRLRIQALTVLQNWFSRHASRPGMMLLR